METIDKATFELYDMEVTDETSMGRILYNFKFKADLPEGETFSGVIEEMNFRPSVDYLINNRPFPESFIKFAAEDEIRKQLELKGYSIKEVVVSCSLL